MSALFVWRSDNTDVSEISNLRLLYDERWLTWFGDPSMPDAAFIHGNNNTAFSFQVDNNDRGIMQAVCNTICNLKKVCAALHAALS